jgi:hypothetical protein
LSSRSFGKNARPTGIELAPQGVVNAWFFVAPVLAAPAIALARALEMTVRCAYAPELDVTVTHTPADHPVPRRGGTTR